MRLSLIAALADDPFATHIDEKSMAFAISWIKYNLEALIEKLFFEAAAREHVEQGAEAQGNGDALFRLSAKMLPNFAF